MIEVLKQIQQCLKDKMYAHAEMDLSEAIAELESQEPVIMWPCHIIEADLHERTITLGMECGDYKVSAGTHWLSTHPPQRTWERPWVSLTDEDTRQHK